MLRKQLAKVPLLYHLLWRTKMVLSNGSRRIKVVTIQDATELVLNWAKKIQNDYDCIIGIPRSGLWVASILALKFGKPLATPNSFVSGEIWHSLHVEKSPIHRVLVVEDDVLYGRQINKAVKQLRTFDPSLQIETASLFVTSQSKGVLDFYYAIKNPPLLYEWTLLTNLKGMGKLAVDMDGVLCEECPCDKNESAYLQWVKTAKPYMIPQFPIDAVVTSRLECYREQTETWLRNHGVKYRELFMLNLTAKKERCLETIIAHKVNSINSVKPFWFWESNSIEAEAIRNKANLPVLCIATLELLV